MTVLTAALLATHMPSMGQVSSPLVGCVFLGLAGLSLAGAYLLRGHAVRKRAKRRHPGTRYDFRRTLHANGARTIEGYEAAKTIGEASRVGRAEALIGQGQVAAGDSSDHEASGDIGQQVAAIHPKHSYMACPGEDVPECLAGADGDGFQEPPDPPSPRSFLLPPATLRGFPFIGILGQRRRAKKDQDKGGVG